MFDLNYYNELCLIARFVDNSYEEAKGFGMYNRTYCHNLNNTTKNKLNAETIDISTQVKIWRLAGHYPYIIWCCSQQHFNGIV